MMAMANYTQSISDCAIREMRSNPFILKYTVIWKEQVVLVVGAASSRDHFISRLEAAPTVSFLW